MAIVTTADIEAALPGVTFTATSNPTAAQVTSFITDVTAEITARLQAASVPWPVDGTAAASYLRTTLIDGALARTLDALYALTSAQGTPTSVDRVTRRYQEAIKALPDIARGVQEISPTVEGRAVPIVAMDFREPLNGESFEGYSERRQAIGQYELLRRFRGYPYGLRGYGGGWGGWPL